MVMLYLTLPTIVVSAIRSSCCFRFFIKSEIIEGQLVISDIRMGFKENYVFSHAVAEAGNPHWYEIESRFLASQFGAEDLDFVWQKLGLKPFPP